MWNIVSDLVPKASLKVRANCIIFSQNFLNIDTNLLAKTYL